MNIIVSIICSEDNTINKISAIKSTYGKLLEENNIKYYFVIDSNYYLGDDECNLHLLNLEEDHHFNIIRNFKNKNYDFLLITYLESFINVNNLLNFLKDVNKEDLLYIGGHGDYRNITNVKFYFHSHTAGIILTKSASNLLLDDQLMNNYNKVCPPELKNISGVALGFYAKLLNLKLVNNDNFYYCNWKGYPCHCNKINKSNIITCGNMSIEDMHSCFSQINKIPIKENNKKNIIIYPGGGFGNVLFQYFNGYFLEKEFNRNVYYQINYNYWRGDINKYKMLQHLNFIDLSKIKHEDYKEHHEKNFWFDPIELDEENYKILGYYQSYKYSQKYIQDIKNELFYNVADLYFKIEKMYYSIKNDKPTCLIHVRRGDYLQYHNVHPTCSDDYYKKAIEIIPNCKYMVFSDDNHFISNWKVIKNLDYEIINLNDPEEILIFMSFCDNFIIANSTLSLVSYLLRRNKDAKLVGPKNWFGPAGYKFKIEDIIPPEGIII
jgi:hypothetical protein